MTDDDHPLDCVTARKVIREIRIDKGWVAVKHCKEQMKARSITVDDIDNMLRAGRVTSAEWENGGWRYRMGTPRITVIVEIDLTERTLIVITAWRNG